LIKAEVRRRFSDHGCRHLPAFDSSDAARQCVSLHVVFLVAISGIVTMVMMFVVGRLAAKVQPKYLIVVGAVLIAVSMYEMTNVYGDLGFWYMAQSRMLLGVGLPRKAALFATISTVSTSLRWRLPPR
jgi:hypothetical protein